MKNLIVIAFLVLIAAGVWADLKRTIKPPKAVTEMSWDERRRYFDGKLDATGCTVTDRKDLDSIMAQLEACLRSHKEALDPRTLSTLPDEPFVIAAVEQAIIAVRSRPREFGIGAVLVKDGKIIERAHNSQLGFNRTDLHAEMMLMTKYEDKTRQTRKGFQYDKDLRVFSSAEPCPMCFTRLLIAGVPTFYGIQSDEDGMAHRKEYFPRSWAAVARTVRVEPARSSRKVNAIAEALFYTYTRFEKFSNLH